MRVERACLTRCIGGRSAELTKLLFIALLAAFLSGCGQRTSVSSATPTPSATPTATAQASPTAVQPTATTPPSTPTAAPTNTPVPVPPTPTSTTQVVASPTNTPALAPPPPPPTNTPVPAPPSLDGRALFSSKGCSACHGANGEGGFGPALAGTTLSFPEVLSQVRNPRGSMPPFSPQQVTDQEEMAIYNYLRSLR